MVILVPSRMRVWVESVVMSILSYGGSDHTCIEFDGRVDWPTNAFEYHVCVWGRYGEQLRIMSDGSKGRLSSATSD